MDPKRVLPEKAVILGFDILFPMAEVGKLFYQRPDDIFIFMGNTVPVTTTQLCHIKAKITKDNIEIMGTTGYGLEWARIACQTLSYDNHYNFENNV